MINKTKVYKSILDVHTNVSKLERQGVEILLYLDLSSLSMNIIMELTSSQFKTVTIILPLGLAQNYIVDHIKLAALLLILNITDR